MGISIRAIKDGFRRCGIAHSKNETTYPDDRFSKEELKVLEAEPMLVVKSNLPDPEKAPKDMTVATLKEELGEGNFPGDAKKDDLVKLVQDKRQQENS